METDNVVVAPEQLSVTIRNLVQTTCVWTIRSLSSQRKRQETNSDGTGITKMAMRTRYDVLRYSRTTWVICACVLLQKYNQQRNQNRIVHCPHQSKSQSRNPTSRNRWSERSFSWPPSPGWLNNQEPPKWKMSKRQATDTDYQERLIQ